MTNDDVILKRISGETNVWYDSNEQVIEKAHKYEKDGQEGTPIISKGELIAYITPDNIYKTKFDVNYTLIVSHQRELVRLNLLNNIPNMSMVVIDFILY